jgi:putative phosphonate metabolism protein
MTVQRYAVYFAPGRDSALAVFGRRWLGRCVETGEEVSRPVVPGVAEATLNQLTAGPRHYGFHATLVAPFVLADDVTPDQLMDQTAALARHQAPCALQSLSVKLLGSFIALIPSDQIGVARLAEACLRRLHPMRAQPTLAELERRRATGLTPNQERLLANWGYPYVLDEYRFHMTLTDSIRDTKSRSTLLRHLSEAAAHLRREPVLVADICLFKQQDGGQFRLVRRFPLDGLIGANHSGQGGAA